MTPDAEPYVAAVGDRTFALAREPGPGTRAKLVSLAEARASVPEQCRLTREVVAELLTEPDRADELLSLLSLDDVVRLVTSAVAEAEDG